MSMLMRYGLTLIFLLLAGISAGQNFEKLGSKDAIKVSGGINFNAIAYQSYGLSYVGRDPFTWYASGNINVSILDVALPFTYTYSNQGGQFTQPFNRTAVHPSYKWVKGHFGLTTMNFSPYSLNGHLFLGGGIQLTPGKWDISLMLGRLNKAVEYDPVMTIENDPVYRRFGYGVSLGYKGASASGKFILFKAGDDPSSLSVIPANTNVKPQDNVVINVQGLANLTKFLTVQAEYALSTLTNNVNSPNDELSIQQKKITNHMIVANATTSHYQAYKASVKTSFRWFSVGLNAEHVDPGYKTLGGYYFNNDLQNYTLTPAFSLWKKKINVSANTGFQRNNLDGDKTATTSRWVNNISVNLVPVSSLILSGTYSNFSTFTRNRPQTDPYYFTYADTLNFYQLTENASCMIVWTFGGSKKLNSLQALYNYQESHQISGAISTPSLNLENTTPVLSTTTGVHAGNLSFSRKLPNWKGQISLIANANYSVLPGQEILFIGPGWQGSKSFQEKKLSLSLGTTYNRQYTNSVITSNVLNHRLSLSFKPDTGGKAGNINCSVNGNYLQRLSTGAGTSHQHELNLFFSLGYQF